MKNQYDKDTLFRSEDISIILQENLLPEEDSKAYIAEDRTSFNILFLLSHDIHLVAKDCDTEFIFKKNQYILHYSSEGNTAELRTKSRDALQYLQIRITYQYIYSLINPGLSHESKEILENMVRNNFIFLHREAPPYMTAEMHLIVKEIINSSKKGLLQRLFIEAKVIKLIILIIEQFNEKKIPEISSKTSSAIKKIVDENYHRNIRIEEIAQIIGINPNKVRKEFKSRYKITLSDYISEVRMLKAKKLVVNKNMMIKEIAIECGYEYVQNFTRAFKKKFGVSPEQLRNR
ncbi:AraC-like DNA-binding protein [Chryseobacterium defluvii]|uniref:AraC-like DNA-binding protein n=1 Tax=Chryseobacterium defluvii TaxID=160396 RepID=A0A840KCA0_9FLAO|nr:AraC family transcriptional regulator [Chryseobacterium defluvii]MBB4807021.1 AraC-like DNA-binding protein [Chryseobacterium defluvii]